MTGLTGLTAFPPYEALSHFIPMTDAAGASPRLRRNRTIIWR
jgi:hypothetical protein